MSQTYAAERFWAKVEKTANCWLWVAKLDSGGYGQFFLAGKHRMAHRISYELSVGLIPDGLTLDHLCRVHRCVRPDHLDPVTTRVNILRGIGPSALNATKTHCPKGHPLCGQNLRLEAGRRRCVVCLRARWRESTARYEARRRHG